MVDEIKVSDIVPCPIMEGEVVSGEAAGLSNRYTLRGVGWARMRDIRRPHELTDACGRDDRELAAEVLAILGDA